MCVHMIAVFLRACTDNAISVFLDAVFVNINCAPLYLEAAHEE